MFTLRKDYLNQFYSLFKLYLFFTVITSYLDCLKDELLNH